MTRNIILGGLGLGLTVYGLKAALGWIPIDDTQLFGAWIGLLAMSGLGLGAATNRPWIVLTVVMAVQPALFLLDLWARGGVASPSGPTGGLAAVAIVGMMLLAWAPVPACGVFLGQLLRWIWRASGETPAEDNHQ